jgi:hypothetical protein
MTPLSRMFGAHYPAFFRCLCRVLPASGAIVRLLRQSAKGTAKQGEARRKRLRLLIQQVARRQVVVPRLPCADPSVPPTIFFHSRGFYD